MNTRLLSLSYVPVVIAGALCCPISPALGNQPYEKVKETDPSPAFNSVVDRWKDMAENGRYFSGCSFYASEGAWSRIEDSWAENRRLVINGRGQFSSPELFLIPRPKSDNRIERMIDWPELSKYFRDGAFLLSGTRYLISDGNDSMRVLVNFVGKSRLSLAMWRVSLALLTEVHGELTFRHLESASVVHVALAVDYTENKLSLSLRSRFSF